jgi:hypothetical protein
VIEYKEEWEKEEKFNVESYINGNTDYWHKPVGCPTSWIGGTQNGHRGQNRVL